MNWWFTSIRKTLESESAENHSKIGKLQLIDKIHYQGIKTLYKALKSYQIFMSIMNFFYGEITIVSKKVMNVLKNVLRSLSKARRTWFCSSSTRWFRAISRSSPPSLQSKLAVPPAKRERARESLLKECFTIATSAGEKIRPGPVSRFFCFAISTADWKQFRVDEAAVAGPGSARDRLLVLTKCIFAA